MAHGRYIGAIENLQGETALLRPGKLPDTWQAQFDNLQLGPELTHAWVQYPRTEWDVFPELF